MKTITVEEYDALCLCKEACKGYVRKVDDGLPPSLLSRVSYKAMQDAVRYFDRQFKDSKRKSSKHPEPKYKVGNTLVWDNIEVVVSAIVIKPIGGTEQVSYRIRHSGNTYHILEYALSPLPDMHIGKEWVLEQAEHECDGMKMRCTGMNVKDLNLYEWGVESEHKIWYDHEETGVYVSHIHKAICIDPRFWTGEILGEPVRCYEDEHGNIMIKILFTDRSGRTTTPYKTIYKGHAVIGDKLWLSAIKNANIPIMPNEMRKNLYGDEFPAPKGE